MMVDNWICCRVATGVSSWHGDSPCDVADVEAELRKQNVDLDFAQKLLMAVLNLVPTEQ